MMNLAGTPTCKKNSPPLIKRVLKLLGLNNGLVQSPNAKKEESVRLNIPEDYKSWKANELALLEAERKKAEALTRRHFIF